VAALANSTVVQRCRRRIAGVIDPVALLQGQHDYFVLVCVYCEYEGWKVGRGGFECSL
jgi:hypothetical protein